MQIIKGKSIVERIAMAKITSMVQQDVKVSKVGGVDSAAEKFCLEAAIEQALRELDALYKKASVEAGEAQAEIFKIHGMMLDDELRESICEMIDQENVNAEFAVQEVGESFAEMFASMEESYMQARAADVRDICSRLIRILSGADAVQVDENEPYILFADDLSPSETVKLNMEKLKGIVTRFGSTQSHTAILARTMNIPALIGVGDSFPAEAEGKLCVIDGHHSVAYIDPTDELIASIQIKMEQDNRQIALLRELKGKADVTADGKPIKLYCNIGNADDVPAALENDAQGIGLFRSEFLYLNSDHWPTEEEQFNVYKKVAADMAGRQVIIRTLDLGADKQADYFNLPKEENPAMGYRAIRICLNQPNIFRTQLRALLRASMFGNIAIMFPMIISVQEVRQIKEMLDQAKSELREEGLAFSERMEIGVMIETPAAVMISRELADEVNFFSIGTNDLTQYTLAIDRQNSRLDGILDPHHPAILRMIRMTVENGHAGGAWVGICGELGADLDLTETFIEMGIDELSVAPGAVLSVRKAIREAGSR